MSDEVVYVIGTPTSTVVKIGRTTRLAKRLADIQRMSPVPLEVLWTHPGGHDLETNLHRQFSGLRSHGEWFTFQADPVAMVAWAVESQPWDRPKLSLQKRKPAKARPKVVPVQRPSFTPRPEVVEALERVITELHAIKDPVQRFERAGQVEEELKQTFLEAQQQIVAGLKAEGRTWQEVGAELGFSGQRAHQLSLGSRPKYGKAATAQ
ncbi:GIY-YIG nuclease family protein [Streptomyces katrae]|uniref:GIY-YIG nuclease family protein n=1 Tax=Streptomyces katrae TaxID=68223 RepID=UPI00131DA146|nr:GIY-YIG nuclease family protein [Streptomyces katrae]